jgi:hypothetical protein
MSVARWLGIPFEAADCVRLTRLWLRAHGIRTRDPRTHPATWEQCDESEAVAVTYRGREHIAPLLPGGVILEAVRDAGSRTMRIDRLRRAKLELEFWRPCYSSR